MKKMILSILLLTLTTVLITPLFAQQTRTLSMIMQEKLVHSQRLLEAIVLERFRSIETNAERIESLSREANWATTQTIEFTRLSAEFGRILDDLASHAREKNLDAAALSYVELTLKCVQCHKHVRGVERVVLSPQEGLAQR